jgi:ATP-dependent protease ClpP protease subunit
MEQAADELCCSYSLARLAVYEVEKQQSIFKQMNPQIKIKNEVDCTVIDIEGTIGLSEEWQFDNPESRVATYERFKECVASIADIRNTKIVVNIRSTGGDVNDALLIYEALRSTGAHVTTRCYGYTASAATIVAQAASEGCREMATTSLYLIHKSLCSTEGNAEELQAEVEMLRQTDLRIAEVYAQRSGRSVEEMSELMSANGGRGRWLSPDEAIAEGLVDCYVSQESAEAEKNSLAKRSKQGVKALLKALGIDTESEPNVDDDINYIPRAVVHNNVEASASPITLGEGQKSAKPTTLRSVQDPSPLSECHDARSIAYERDAQIIKMR